MWLAIPLIVLFAIILYEYRLRRPDQFILFESKGTIGFRTARWYPRHFSLALPGTTHLLEPRIEATAKGSIPITVKLALSVAPSREAIPALVRAGGWEPGAVIRAAKEVDTLLLGQIKEFTEQVPVEDLSAEKIHAHLSSRLPSIARTLGLELIALTVQSVDPVDSSIAEAMRQRESARIIEQTETINQKARVAAAQSRLRADEQIAYFEHELELKKSDLKRAELEKESAIAQRRVEDEVARGKMKLAFDREEMELLKDHPQLLLLTPQVARLAEASQALRNARTVVSLSPGEAEQGSGLLNMFALFLQNLVQATARPGEKKSKNT